MNIKFPFLLIICLLFTVPLYAQKQQQGVFSRTEQNAFHTQPAKNAYKNVFFHPEDGTIVANTHIFYYQTNKPLVLPQKPVQPTFALNPDKAAAQVFLALEQKTRQARAKQANKAHSAQKLKKHSTPTKLPGKEGNMMNLGNTVSDVIQKCKNAFCPKNKQKQTRTEPKDGMIKHLSEPGRLLPL